MSDTPPIVVAAPTPAEVAAELERLAEVTGDDAFKRAARALFQDRPGRRPINDTDALAEAEELARIGAAQSMGEAFRMVASTMGERRQVRAIAERLRRKHRRMQKVAAK